MKDVRLPEVRKIVEAIISKSSLYNSDIYLASNNHLLICVDNTLLYYTILKSQDFGPDICFKYKDIMVLEDLEEYIYSTEVYYKLSELDQRYSFLMCNAPLIAKFDSLRGDENFENLLSLKAKDGMRYYKIIGENGRVYMIPILPGFPNVSSQDDIGIEIYDIKDGHLIIKYNIMKKKIARSVSVMMRIINVN